MADSQLTHIKILSRIRPEVWELVGGGPLPDPWSSGPIPQPWRRIDDTWALGAQLAMVNLTRRLTDAASLTQAQGGDGPGLLRSVMDDDWGFEGRPIEIKLPPGWWLDYRPPPPRPNELDVLAVMGAAAISFAALSEGIRDESLSHAVEEAAIRSMDLMTETSLHL
ncbi:hypothetical protein ACFW9U_28290 [Rhodococcus aetherivorans]|uniref:hypothetical protein n=1 Tax=Rhodococcus aetherivorans TaxID=191292 RepID=UPI00366BF52F